MTLAFMGMTWLTPLTGIVLAGVLVPLLVALYILKLRRKAAAIPSTLLWKRSVEDLRANAPFQRLRPNILLLLQLLLLAFVAFALAQPRMDIGASAGGRTVLLIDRSASMGATDLDAKKTRLEVAKEQAAKRVEDLFAGGIFSATPGEVMVVSFSDGAKVEQPFTRSKMDVLRAIESLKISDGGSRINEALTLSRAYTTVTNPDDPKAVLASPATFVLYSDGRIADLAGEALRPGEDLIFQVIGRADATNLGIDSISAERSISEPGTMQVSVSLRNDSTEPAQTEMQLGVDGNVRAVFPKPVEVKGGSKDPSSGQWKPGTERVTFPPIVQPRAGAIRVEILRPDVLPVDNVADIAVAAPKRLKMAVVGPMEFAVLNVVQALPAEKIETLTIEEFAERTKSTGSTDYDVVVAMAGSLPSPVPGGRYMILGLPAGLEGLQGIGPKERLSVLSARQEHPILRAVNLTTLFVAKAEGFVPDADVEKLVESTGTPLVVLYRRGATQAVVLGFDPMDSNWPFERGFVTFVANTVEWLGSIDQAAAQEEHRAGQALVARLPIEAKEIKMRLPSGEEQTLAARDGVITFGPVERAGVYVLTWMDGKGEGRRVFAVNPTPGEGYVAAADNISLGTKVVEAQHGSGSILSDLWPFALAAAILLLVVEWWVYHRKHWIRKTAAPLKAAPIIRA